MRTTLSLEEDISRELRKQMLAKHMTLKVVINEALRQGLRSLDTEPEKPEFQFQVEPHDFGFRPGVDLDKIGQFADNLEDEERFRKLSR